jgi:hypothetical protein
MLSIKLLPNKYKLIGTIILILSIPLIILLMYFVPVIKTTTGLAKSIVSIIAIIGFALIIFSKEKIEDEFIEHCRLKAFAVSFSIGITTFIVFEIASILDKEAGQTIFQALFNQCLFYVVYFFLLKNNFYSKNEKQGKRN